MEYYPRRSRYVIKYIINRCTDERSCMAAFERCAPTVTRFRRRCIRRNGYIRAHRTAFSSRREGMERRVGRKSTFANLISFSIPLTSPGGAPMTLADRAGDVSRISVRASLLRMVKVGVIERSYASRPRDFYRGESIMNSPRSLFQTPRRRNWFISGVRRRGWPEIKSAFAGRYAYRLYGQAERFIYSDGIRSENIAYLWRAFICPCF